MQERHGGRGAAQGPGLTPSSRRFPRGPIAPSAAHLLLGPVRVTRRHRGRGEEEEGGKEPEGGKEKEGKAQGQQRGAGPSAQPWR